MSKFSHRQEMILLKTKYIFENENEVDFVQKLIIFINRVFPKIEELYRDYPNEFEEISSEIHAIIFKQEIIENTFYLKNKNIQALNKFRDNWVYVLRTKSEVLKKNNDLRLFNFLVDYAKLGDSWLKSSSGGVGIFKEANKDDDGYCYIATMVYGDYNHPKVILLRNFRDKRLGKYKLGKLFIKYYYKYSPSLVKLLTGKILINKFLTFILEIFIKKIQSTKF